MEEEMKRVQKEASLNLQLCETLKEISRLSGTLTVNGMMMEDEELAKMLTNEGEVLKKFSKKLAKYLAK